MNCKNPKCSNLLLEDDDSKYCTLECFQQYRINQATAARQKKEREVKALKKEFEEIYDENDLSLWPVFRDKVERLLFYFADKYPYLSENIGKHPSPGDHEKSQLHTIMSDINKAIKGNTINNLDYEYEKDL